MYRSVFAHLACTHVLEIHANLARYTLSEPEVRSRNLTTKLSALSNIAGRGCHKPRKRTPSQVDVRPPASHTFAFGSTLAVDYVPRQTGSRGRGMLYAGQR